VLYYTKLRIEPRELSTEELWQRWEVSATKAVDTMATGSGPIVAMYKVVGQRRVIVINDVESPDDMDRILMGGNMSPYMEVEDMLPLREYSGFAEDVRQRWSVRPSGIVERR
jgi:muconolactone D-isomerase